MEFLRFSGRLGWRALVLAVGALKIGNDFWGIVVSGLLIAGTSVSLFAWYEQHVRWWVPAGIFLLLFLYGLFRASYEEVTQRDGEIRRVEGKRAELEAKLEAAEGRNAPKIVVDKEYKAPNGGAVLGNMGGESGLVPLLFSTKAPRGLDTPAANIEVDGPEDTHVVAVRYEVRSGDRHRYQPEKTIRTATHLQVLDESGKVVMYPTIYNGMADVDEDGFWRYTVSRSYALSGLAKGAYDLRVLDYASGKGERNYYDVKLLVTKLGKSAASPVTEN